MKYQRGWPPKRQKHNNKMACVAGAKGRRGGGENRDQMIKKTLLQELTVKMIYGRWGIDRFPDVNSSDIEIR